MQEGSLILSFSIGFVYQKFAVDIEEEHWVFVSFLENPAATILAVNLCLDVFAAYFLLSQKFVVLVEYLEVGVTVTIVDYGIHYISADGIADHINIVGVFYIFVHHRDVGYMIVVPVGVAVEPETGPEERTWRYGNPDDGAHVDHVMVIWMMEVGSRMHGAM